jgi:uncharacterized membrane protein
MRAWEIHPALVHFPIAFLIGGVVLDLFGRSSETAVATATYLLIVGLATGAIAAVTGILAYYTVPGNHTAEAHQRVYWHIWTIVMAVTLFTVVCFVRWQAPSVVSPPIRGLGLVAVAIMAVGAYIGGKLVYHGGLGIDPAILKPGLRSMAEANNSLPASPAGAAMTKHFGKPVER